MMIEDPTVTTVRRDWPGEEEALPGAWSELKRLARRSRRRWLRVILYSLALSALVVGMVARKPRSYASRVVFRVNTPRTSAQLHDYVANVVFANVPDDVRRDLDVEIWRDDLARSARLAITYRGRDAQAVYDTTRDLGRLLGESERRSRALQAEEALRQADDQLESLQKAATVGKRAVLDKQMASQLAGSSEERLRLVLQQRELEKAAASAQKQSLTAEKRLEQLYARIELEKRALGSRWLLIDAGGVEPEGMSRELTLAWLGGLAFLLALPFSCIGVGAFDPHVYDLDDVRRLGMPTVGAVRRFDGDNAGALVARLGGRARMTRS